MKWNDAQLTAIRTIDAELLVSAAAGSGKTAVLTERCLYLTCDAPDPCSIDQLLVVTFTRAAAGEMKRRIEERLIERIGAAAKAGSTDLRRLNDQVRRLDRAEIGTLHGVCGRIVRRHFNLLGIDPAFTTLDENEAMLLRLETADRVIEHALSEDENGQLQELIDAYAGSRDANLRDLVLRVYELSRSTPDPRGWSDQTVARLLEAANARTLEDSQLGRWYLEEIRAHVASLLAQAQRVRKQVQAIFPGYLALLDELINGVTKASKLAEKEDLAALSKHLADMIENKPRAPTFRNLDEASEAKKKQAKDLIDELRKHIDDKRAWLVTVLRFSPDLWRMGLKQCAAVVKTLLGVVNTFDEAYRQAKLAARSLDFGDLERLAYRVLRDPTSPAGGPDIPSPAARMYQAQFRHVLVDEYQDINALQDAILRLLSHESSPDLPPNLFCVGDVKQSIYRFRLADPFRFLDRARRYQNAKPGEKARLIPLSENYRSTPAVIDTVNAVFDRIMQGDWAEVQYDPEARLRPGLPEDQYALLKSGEAAVELHLLESTGEEASGHNGDNEAPPGPDNSSDDELDRIEREAVIVAQRIRTLVDGMDGFRYSDVAILLRAMQHKAHQFAAMLRRFGVPVHAEAAGGFFAATEVQDVLSLLRVLDNPLQDIPLASLLRSPLGRLDDPDDKLARVRLLYTDENRRPFHRAVFDAAAGASTPDDLRAPLVRILADLDRWRGDAISLPIATVLWNIFHETGYLAYCSALRDGPQRVANLMHLHDLARQFGTFQKQGLRRFLAFLMSMEQQSDLAQPNVVLDPGNVVRVMSVHRSKGLQFPVVIIPDLGKKMNLSNARGNLLLDRDVGIAPKVVDLDRRVRYPSLASVIAQRRIRRKLAAEELRVLYVAMTRAKRKLILMGTVGVLDKVKQWQDAWSTHAGPLPADVLESAVTMLDWIGPAYTCTAAQSPALIDMVPHDAKAIAQAETNAQAFIAGPSIPAEILHLSPLKPAPAKNKLDHARETLASIAWRHPMGDYAFVPAARAVTQLTKSGRRATGGESVSDREVVRFERPLPPPAFTNPKRKPSPTDIGQATHRFLQAMRLDSPPTSDGVIGELKRLVDRRILSPAEASAVDVDAVAWFLGTEPGGLMRNHPDQTWRELPIFVPSPPLHAPDRAAPPQSGDPLDRTMLRGQIDALIRLPSGLVIIDYKTDAVTPATLPDRVEFYRPQVWSYCQAIAQITKLPVVGVHLAFLVTRSLVDVTPDQVP